MPEIAIVVPLWDDYPQSDDTIHFVDQMLNEVIGDFALILVDNASPSPVTQDLLRMTKDPRFHVIHNNANLGYGTAANIGVQRGIELGAEYVLVMNQDVHISDPNWIENAFLSELREHQNRIVGARKIDFNTGTAYDGKNNTPYLEGWLIACHKDVWVDLGGFDTQIFNWHEDCELSLRAVQKGYELKQSDAFHWVDWYTCVNPPVTHYYGRTGYINLEKYVYESITEQSRQYVIQKHFDNKEKDAETSSAKT